MASGMTALHRPRDLDEVIQLICINQLSKDLSGLLNPYVAALDSTRYSFTPISSSKMHTHKTFLGWLRNGPHSTANRKVWAGLSFVVNPSSSTNHTAYIRSNDDS